MSALAGVMAKWSPGSRRSGVKPVLRSTRVTIAEHCQDPMMTPRGAVLLYTASAIPVALRAGVPRNCSSARAGRAGSSHLVAHHLDDAEHAQRNCKQSCRSKASDRR